MTRQPASIFNDVIGPVMIGPSSSHTAASVRIGYLLRALCDNAPAEVEFQFSRQGSLANCHKAQGTDLGLAAGLLGMALTDARFGAAEQLARAAGIAIRYTITDEPVPHPNTYTVIAAGGNRRVVRATLLSTGGGMLALTELNGVPLAITGGYQETLFWLGRCGAERARAAQERLQAALPALDELLLCRNTAGEMLLNLRTQEPLSAAQLALIEAETVYQLPPVLPIRSQKHYAGLCNTAAQILERAAADSLPLWQIAADYEARRGGITEVEVHARMRDLVRIWRETLTEAEQSPRDYADRILGSQAHRLATAPQLPNATLNAAIKQITLLMEAKSALQVIIAAPTAGSCACLPGTLIAAAQVLQLDEQTLIQGLLAAGLVGVLIAEHSTFAAEVGGCQAECGSGSAMAAAGLAQMLGGSAAQCLNAASLALQNILGLVCDPVAGHVEVPCLGKNILAGANAISMCNLALAGFDVVIPLDQVIQAHYKVGLKMDASLRCTCGGGLSVTEAAREIERRLENNAAAATELL